LSAKNLISFSCLAENGSWQAPEAEGDGEEAGGMRENEKGGGKGGRDII
jgi:hypothetical protein